MIFLVLIIIVNIISLSRLNFLPYPELFVYPYLTNHGLIPYKDILDQHFPGLMFFPVNLGTMGMHSPAVARIWQYLTVTLIHLLLFSISKQIFKSKKYLAIIPNVIFLIWQPFFEGWVLWIDSFLPVFTLSALYFLRKNKLFWAGFFLGIAMLFKQVVLPLIGLVGLYLLIKKQKLSKIFHFVLGVTIPTSILAIYITKLGIWKDFVFWTVTFNMTTFAKMGRKYGTLSEWIRVIGVYGFSFISILNKKVRQDVILICLFVVGSLASVYARFDFVHLQPSLPFVALLSAIAIGYLIKRKYFKILVLVYIASSVFLVSRFYRSQVGNKVFFFSSKEQIVVSEIQKLSEKGDKIFAFGTLPHIYQMADRLPSGNIFVFQFPWFMMEAQDRILEGLMNDPPKVILRDSKAEVEGKNLVSFMPKINDYINSNYKITKNIEEIEILIKK